MRKPKVGDLVEIEWVDSGLETNKKRKLRLDIAKTRGKVLKVEECPKLKAKVPRGFDCTVVVLEMCSSLPTIGVILWSTVIGVKKMR